MVNRQWAISEYYKSGWRAYQNFDGGKVLYKDGVYHHTIASGHHSEAGKWHSLRAYQDEERKKGVPITLGENTAGDWIYRDYAIHGKKYVFYQVDTGAPRIQVYDSIHMTADGRNCIARFTNFRWREGYPMSPTQMSETSQKGGQNG